jgi:hypothetical protein
MILVDAQYDDQGKTEEIGASSVVHNPSFTKGQIGQPKEQFMEKIAIGECPVRIFNNKGAKVIPRLNEIREALCLFTLHRSQILTPSVVHSLCRRKRADLFSNLMDRETEPRILEDFVTLVRCKSVTAAA